MTTTPLMLDLCERHDPSPLDPTFDLKPWVASLRQAVSTGAQYSNAFAITDEASANAVGQRYHGPVVLVTDALCYSATDIFAAGFQDHGIGPVLGVDGNTGAGGANVWTHELLKLLLDTAPDDGGPEANPFVDLPGGRRVPGVGAAHAAGGCEEAGTPVEDLGVVPDERHEPHPGRHRGRQRGPAGPGRRAAGGPDLVHAGPGRAARGAARRAGAAAAHHRRPRPGGRGVRRPAGGVARRRPTAPPPTRCAPAAPRRRRGSTWRAGRSARWSPAGSSRSEAIGGSARSGRVSGPRPAGAGPCPWPRSGPGRRGRWAAATRCRARGRAG